MRKIALEETTIRLQVEPLREGGFVATSPDVPGLVAQGRTLAETAEIAQALARKIAETLIQKGWPLPAALRPLNSNKIKLSLPISLPS